MGQFETQLREARLARRARLLGRGRPPPGPAPSPPAARQRPAVAVEPPVHFGFAALLRRAEVLAESPSARPPIRVNDILRAVCAFYGVTLIDLNSRRRTAALVRPRHVAMYLCRTLTLCSMAEIGRAMGERDHTTVMHGAQKVAEQVRRDETLGRELDLLSRQLAAAFAFSADGSRSEGGQS
jgi:hypothetical protein